MFSYQCANSYIWITSFCSLWSFVATLNAKLYSKCLCSTFLHISIHQTIIFCRSCRYRFSSYRQYIETYFLVIHFYNNLSHPSRGIFHSLLFSYFYYVNYTKVKRRRTAPKHTDLEQISSSA